MCHLFHSRTCAAAAVAPFPLCAFGMNIQHITRVSLLVQSPSRKFGQIGPVRGNGPLQVNKIVFADLLLWATASSADLNEPGSVQSWLLTLILQSTARFRFRPRPRRWGEICFSASLISRAQYRPNYGTKLKATLQHNTMLFLESRVLPRLRPLHANAAPVASSYWSELAVTNSGN